MADVISEQRSIGNGLQGSLSSAWVIGNWLSFKSIHKYPPAPSAYFPPKVFQTDRLATSSKYSLVEAKCVCLSRSTLVLETGSHRISSSQIGLDRPPGKPCGSPRSISLVLGAQVHSTTRGFLPGCWNLNSGPSACVTSA